MIRKPDAATLEAADLYAALTRVIVLASIYEPEALEAVKDWVRTSDADSAVTDAAVLLLERAGEMD